MQPPIECYRSSGKVRWKAFLPLAFLTLVCGGLLGWGLQALGAAGHFNPLAPSFAVFLLCGPLYLSIAVGRCRHRGVACLAGLLASSALFIGYYQARMVAESGL